MSLIRIKALRPKPASHAEEIADARFDADLTEWMAEQKPREIRTAEALEQFNEENPT